MNNNCNTSNVTNTSNLESLFHYILYPIILALMIWYGFVMYVIITNMKDLGNYAYHACLVTMGVYDLLILTQLGLIGPIMGLFNVLQGEQTIWALKVCMTISDGGRSFTTTFITTNRATAVLYWNKYSDIFTTKRTFVFCAVTLVCTLASGIPMSIRNLGYVLIHTCNGDFRKFAPGFIKVLVSKTILLAVINFTLYLVIYFYIRYRRKKTGADSKSEHKILIQSFIIVLLNFISFIFVLGSLSKIPARYRGMVMRLLHLTNAGLNSFLYVIFSTNIRQLVIKKLKMVKKTTTVTPMPPPDTNNKDNQTVNQRHC